MLTPTVRAAAAAYAATQDRPVSGAVEHGYLVGYCVGVRAPRAHRFPLAGDATFKRLLGQYLAENITVFHPATGRYGLLRGLPACYEGQGEPLADVEFYADAEAREEGGGDLLEPYGKILPCLYGFEDLATELVLADGRRVVPAVEVAKLSGMYAPSSASMDLGAYEVRVVHHNRAGLRGEFALSKVFFDKGNLFQPVADFLRAAHFAVGLTPHQYHRRVAGFDYASGGSPSTCGACERKEVCRA